MKLLLPLLLLVTPTSAEFTDYRSQYTEALAKFGNKDGIPTSESKEMAAYRYNSFVSFASEVAAINADDSLPFTAENNFLSVLTPEERKSYYGLNISRAVEVDNLVSFTADDSVSAPSTQDFRSKIPAVKDQGSCGSCWTFSATAALEGEIYFVSGTKVSTSEQEYLDCASSGNGCNGGWMEDCYDYSQKSGRIATTSAAPYKKKDQGCSSSYKKKDNALKKAGVLISGAQSITNDAALLKAAASHVISVAVKVSNAFSSYKSGVMTSKTGCMSQPDHAVAVVGYGKSGGSKYWLVRNSWGKAWGDAGHIKMSRDIQNMCNIAKYGIIPTLKCSNGKSSCKKDDNDDSDDGNDDSDDGNDDDGNDDGDNSGWCWDDKSSKKTLKKALKKCYTSYKGAVKACESKNGACKAIMKKNKKCYQIGSSRATKNIKSKNKFVQLYRPCGNDGNDGNDGDDSGGKCGSALVWCKSCKADDGSKGCCVHEHMCKD